MERWTQGAREDTARWVNKAAKVKGQLLYQSTGVEYVFYCNNRVNKEQHLSNKCKNATLLVLKLELKMLLKIGAFPNKTDSQDLLNMQSESECCLFLRKTVTFCNFSLVMHNCEKIGML